MNRFSSYIRNIVVGKPKVKSRVSAAKIQKDEIFNK